MDDVLDKILDVCTEDLVSQSQSILDEDAKGNLYQKQLGFDFWVQSSLRNPEKHVEETEQMLNRYMKHYCGLNMSGRYSCSFEMIEKAKRNAWSQQLYFVATLKWDGVFGLNSKNILMLFDSVLKIVERCMGITVRFIQVLALDENVQKYDRISTTSEISQSFPMHKAIYNLLYNPERFENSSSFNDCIDGLMELVTRMLKHDKLLNQETMRFIEERSLPILKRSPLMNIITGDALLFRAPDKICDGTLMKVEGKTKFVKNFLFGVELEKFLERKPEKDLTRTLFICKTIKKKRGTMIIIPVNGITLESEKLLETYAANLDRFKALSLRRWDDKTVITKLYSLNLMYGDNESYYVALMEQTRK